MPVITVVSDSGRVRVPNVDPDQENCSDLTPCSCLMQFECITKRILFVIYKRKMDFVFGFSLTPSERVLKVYIYLLIINQVGRALGSDINQSPFS